jgi:hypothetical protein
MCQPRTQALSTTRLAGGKTLVQAGHVSPRQILGDNNWDLSGVGKANVAFEFKTIQGVRIKQHKGLYLETKFLLACIFHKIRPITVIVRDEVVNKTCSMKNK